MTETKIQLTFETENGKSFSLYIDNPVEPADPLAVADAMNTILTANVISSINGELVKAKSAKVISRTVTEVTVA